MFVRLVRKEVLLHVREARFVWVAGFFCGLVLLGLGLMSRDYSRRLEGYQTSVAAERRQVFSVDAGETILRQVRELVNGRGIYAFRPPRALGPLASGLEGATPTQIHVSDRQVWARQASERFYQNPLLSLFPRPDYAYIVGAVLSLVALFFTFDAICGEKVNGTLKLTMSTGVSRDRLLLGKWAGAMLTLGGPFLLATGMGMVLLSLVGRIPLGDASLVRVAGIVGLAFVYLSVFVTLGLAISVLARRPSSALLICLAVWVGTTVVLPNMLASLGRVLSPVPTFQQVRMQKRAIDQERAAQNARLARLVESGGITGEERERRQEALREASEAEKGRIDAGYLRQLDGQIEVSRALSRASPAACLTYAAAELADTGLRFYRRTHEGYAQYRKAFRAYAQRLKQEAGADELDKDWLKPEEVPVLAFHSRGLAEAFGAVTVEVMVLVLFQVLAFVGAYVGFLRYDVS